MQGTKPATRTGSEHRGTLIEMQESHKFLGVILDQELCFKEHAAYTHRKGIAAAAQI